MKDLFKKLKENIFIQMLAVMAILVLSLYMIFNSCDRMIKESEEETGKSFFQQLGEETKKIKDEFNKGLNASDSTKKDTIKIK